MLLIDFLIVFAIALGVAALFSVGGRRFGLGLDLLLFFMLLFLATWALGGWFRPLGPPVWGVYWFPYLIVALLIALLLSAATSVLSRRAPPAARETEREERTEAAVALTFGIFFWIFLIAAAVAIVASYFF